MKRYVLLAILLAILFGLTIWMTAIKTVGIFDMAPPVKVLSATLRHLQIVGIAESLAIIIAIPFGFLLTRRSIRYISPILIGTANMGQTVPTLAFIGITSAALGLGLKAAILALMIYAMLPIIRNTYAGIKSVDATVVEAATGMGMNRRQIIFRIELPMAIPVIIAGIRTSTVVNVGTAAIAGMIGAGGLGELIITGISVSVMELILQGAAPTAALAIILDALLERLERFITPRGLSLVKEAQ